MRLTMLTDDCVYGQGRLLAEHGVCYFIEDDGKKILFDTGSTDIFLSNATRFSLDPVHVDKVVISHGHYDHSGGFYFLLRMLNDWSREKDIEACPEFVACPEIFNAKIWENRDIGMLLDYAAIARSFKMNLSADPVWLTDNLVFLAHIPRQFSFEKYFVGKTMVDGYLQNDHLQDDSALAYKGKDGIVVITACSHSGICNITEYAKQVCGMDKVVAIVGGLHLMQPGEERLQKTVAYIAELGLRDLYACHCTDLNSKLALAKKAPLRGAGVGLELEF